MKIELNNRVRIVSEAAAAREGVEVGTSGVVISWSWKVRDGFLVKCDDEMRRHFCASELQLVLRRKKEEIHESEAAIVSLHCVVCGKHDELNAEDSDALLGKRYRCAACKGRPRISLNERMIKQNRAVLGMSGAPTSLSMHLISPAERGDRPETAKLLATSLKNEQPKNLESEINLKSLNAKHTAARQKVLAEFREIMRSLLATTEMRGCGSVLERLAFLKTRVEGKAIRKVAVEINVSKSGVPALVTAFENKMFWLVKAALLNPHDWSSEFAAIAKSLAIALNITGANQEGQEVLVDDKYVEYEDSKDPDLFYELHGKPDLKDENISDSPEA